MIDSLTMSFPTSGCFLPEAQAITQGRPGTSLQGWAHNVGSNCSSTGEHYQTRRFTHGQTGLKVMSSTHGTKVEFSAPRMLAETNARLLQNDAELGEALKRAMLIAGEVVMLNINDGHLTRVDNTCYVAASPTILLPLFEQRKHPTMQKLPMYKHFESLTCRQRQLFLPGDDN